MRLAKAKRQLPTLPEPEARARTARAEQRVLATVHTKIAQIEDEIFSKRLSLKFFDFEKDGGGVVGAMNRAELRTVLRSMPEEKRQAMMKSFRFSETPRSNNLPRYPGYQTCCISIWSKRN